MLNKWRHLEQDLGIPRQIWKGGLAGFLVKNELEAYGDSGHEDSISECQLMSDQEVSKSEMLLDARQCSA